MSFQTFRVRAWYLVYFCLHKANETRLIPSFSDYVIRRNAVKFSPGGIDVGADNREGCVVNSGPKDFLSEIEFVVS